MKILSLFFWNSRLKIQRAFEYRADFFVGIFISLVYAAVGPITQYLIYTNTKGYPGWSIQQVILFQGVFLIWMGLRDLLFGDVRGLIQQIVQKGDFDRFLLKPFPPIATILSSGFSLNSSGSLIAGLVVTVWAGSALHVQASLLGAVLLILCAVAALLFYMAILTAVSGVILVLIQMGRIWEIGDAFLRFGEYPVNILSKALQVIFVAVFPVAVFVFLPSQILLGRLEYLMLLSLASCVVLFALSLRFWKFCLSRYTSAGG